MIIAMWLNPKIGDSPKTKVQLHGGPTEDLYWRYLTAGSIRAPNPSIGGVLGLHPASQGPLEPKMTGHSVPRRVPSSNLVVYG